MTSSAPILTAQKARRKRSSLYFPLLVLFLAALLVIAASLAWLRHSEAASDPTPPHGTGQVPATKITDIERAAFQRCVNERGGREPEFTRRGLGCYVYFATSQTFAIPAPPATDAEEAALLVRMKSKRTPQALQAIRAQEHDPLPLFWAAAAMNPDEHPQIANAVRIALNDGANLTLLTKAGFERKRPHVINQDVAPVIEVPWHSSYPSGHATQAVLAASILSCVRPQAKAALHELALEVAHNREIAGVHYPSDTKAGLALGAAIFERLKANAEFSKTVRCN